ncbi:response regulator transcription factor [Paractinoplanes durhamensis]|uniref:DNA-binding response regulator n=1 Tax=Paractinoplanes durhamensis TaxID=113563 RepID=A0ABQ3YTI3_9ACTN|nr:response regulator transcription factor [Actinoplanes durhamensis]GIE00896.1 DNA-binding response regulator [Actinoplanes durhamensis]
MPALRVAIVDDHAIFRTAVSAYLESKGVDVLVNVATGEELIAGMAEHPVDVAVIDVRLTADSDEGGIEVARIVKRQFPGVAILILSAYTATAQAIGLISDFERSIGYLRKDELGIDDLGPQLARLVAGEQVLGRSFVDRLLRPPLHASPLNALTRQEREALRLMAQGHSNAGIAQALSIAERTVEDHVRRIFEKLGVNSGDGAMPSNKRVLAVLTWLRENNPD